MVRTIHVARVTPFAIKGGFKYWIYPVGSTTPLETLSVYKASIAERACHLKRPVTVGLKDTRWGQEIVTIELEAA